MKILIVTQYFWPESFLVNSMAEDLASRNHEVSVLTGLPNYPQGKFYFGYSFFRGPWREKWNDVNIFRVPILARGNGFFRLALNYLSFVFFGAFGVFFRRYYKSDVIFCFALSPITSCFPAILLSWLSCKPLVIWVQDLWPESVSAVGAVKSPWIMSFLGLVVRFIYKSSDKIFIQSEAFRMSIMKWGIPSEKIIYVPNWADPFPSFNLNPQWVEDLPMGFKVGFAGNIGKAQDMKTLLQAAILLKEYADIKWIIAGDGSERVWIEDEVKKNNLQDIVITVGRKSYADMLPFFKKADVMLVLLTDESIFSLTVPSKVQAYMAAGKPILASIAGEGARVVEDAQSGYTCPPERPDLLAQTVLKMRDLSLIDRSQMGSRGFEYFKAHFERNIVMNQIEKFLLEIVERGRN